MNRSVAGIVVLLVLFVFAAGCEGDSASSPDAWALGEDASIDATRADASDGTRPQVQRNVCGLEEPEDRGWIDQGDGIWRRDFPAFEKDCGRYQLSVQFELSPHPPQVVLDYQVCNTCDEERVLDVGIDGTEGDGLEVDHVEQPLIPFVMPVLWDSQGRHYPIPCEEYAFMSITGMERRVGTVRRTHFAPHEGLRSADSYVITRFAMRESMQEVIGGNYEPINVEDPQLRLQLYWAPLKPEGAPAEEAATLDVSAFCDRAEIPVPTVSFDVDFERFPAQNAGAVELPDAYHQLWE